MVHVLVARVRRILQAVWAGVGAEAAAIERIAEAQRRAAERKRQHDELRRKLTRRR